MDRIRCPHCGAVNQDVEPSDACWQCEKTLGAAPKSTPGVEVASAPSTLLSTAGEGAPVQQLKTGSVANAPTLEERVAARKAMRQRKNLVPIAVVIAVLLILVILFFVLKH